MFLLFLLQQVFAGTIWSSTISNTIANKNQRSDYTFVVIPETNVPAGGEIEIVFPIQYKANLGDQAYCSNCKIHLHTVTFYRADPILSVPTTLKVFNILNPAARGGTGNFIARTVRNEFIYDENLILATIGIADEIQLMSLSLVSTAESPTAGALTKYNFAFKTNTNLPKGATIQLFVPEVFTISPFPSCSLYPINGVEIEGTVLCTRLEGNKIQVAGFANEILSGSEVGIQVSMTNPQYSQITQRFSIAAFREGTSVIYTWRTEINSVQILPGLIKEVGLKPLRPVRQATGKVMDYSLSFLPTNPLPSGAYLRILFPTTFRLVSGTLYDYVYLKQGLDDVSESQPLQITYTTNDITFSSFGAMSPRVIIVYFRAINPSTAGPTEALTIRTYTDSTLSLIIDENRVDAKTAVELVASLSPSPVTTSPAIAEAQEQSINLIFRIVPTVVITPGAFIKILLEESFSVGTISAANCLATTTPVVQSLFCNKSDTLIMWRNPNTIQYNTNVPNYFGISNLILTPIYARNDYLIDVEIISSSGVILQSYSDYIQISPRNILPSSSVTMISREYSTAAFAKFGIFIATFQNAITVPQGGYDPTNIQSFARIEFIFGATPASFDPTLGTTIANGGLIPCKAVDGLLPLAGLRIICNLYYATATSGPKVVMRNFQEIPDKTTITVHIPNLKNPTPAGTPATLNVGFTINIVQYDYRWRTVLNQLLPTVTYLAQAGAVPGDASSDMDISNWKISGVFNLTTTIGLGVDLIAGSFLIVKLPGYDTMFLPYEDTVVCYIDTYLTPCITYPGVDWILLTIQNVQIHYYALFPKLYLYNLNWPRYEYSFEYIRWVVVQGSLETEIKRLMYNQVLKLMFPSPQAASFDVAKILSPKKGRGYVGLVFEFYFKCSYAIPNDSTFKLTFPSDFSLDGSFPEAVFQAPQFQGVSSTKPLTYSAAANILTISNIKEFPASGPFTVLVKGVRTRKTTASSTATPFLAEIQLNSRPIVKTTTTFDTFQYTSRFSPGKVIFQSITAFPNNQLERAEYAFNFVLSNELLEGGVITLTFPFQFYTALPTPGVDCRCNITGGLSSYKSCRRQGNSYIIITDQRYQSGEIIWSLTNIPNPQAGKVFPFTIKSNYDSEFLDISDDALLEPRSLIITNKAEPLLVQSIDFYPRNEGEEATYVFQVVPSSYIDSAFVVITFPPIYDARVGNQIACKPYDCTVSKRQIWVSGITSYTPLGTSPLTIYVLGVINPNRNQNDHYTGQFAIGVIKQNSFNFVDYNSQAGQLQIAQAPGWAYLYTVAPSNQYSRWANTSYFFNMTSLLPVPKTAAEGSIIVDFPKQFDIPDSKKLCKSVPNIHDNKVFAETTTCSSSSNSITVSGHIADVNGIISFNVSEVANPPDEVTIENIYIKTYDGQKKEIVEKSYRNLDPWTFAYKFPGPLITINEDQLITVERGTQTRDLWIKVAYPCALNLTFVAKSNIGLQVVPSEIRLSLTDLQQKFRVSAPEDTPPATYALTWEVTGENDVFGAVYTPVKKSLVKVTNNKNIRIDVALLNEIPINGTSLDTQISVDYAPNLGFEVLLTSLTSVLILETRSVQFIAGQNNATFRVRCDGNEYQRLLTLNQLSTMSIQLILSGINQKVYILSQTRLDAIIIPKDTEPPFITTLMTDKTSQTQTDLILSSGELSVIYYMVALRGTATPTQKTLKDLGPAPYKTTASQFGKVSIGKSNTATVRIRNLRAQTPYIVFAVAEDRGGLFSDVKNFQFQTKDRYNASSTTLYFKQSYLNQAERENILRQIAFVLSIPTYKVETSTSVQARRLLQQEVGLSIFIISNPELENFPAPLRMVDELNKRLDQLSKRITTLDKSRTLTGFEFQPYYPSFVTKPYTTESDFYSCKVLGKLDRRGKIFLIAVLASQDTQSPYAQQVWWGFNSQNVAQKRATATAEVPNQDYIIEVKDLDEDTDYNIYMIAGSAHPGYPDLSNLEADMHLVPCRTKARNGTVRLDINQAPILVLAAILGLLI